MELIIGIIFVISAYWGGKSMGENSQKTAPTPESQEMVQCAKLCESGVVATYKWCKCNSTAIWDSGTQP